MYRRISQKLASFPSSNQAVKQTVAINNGMNLTPQETEQLSRYAADETYVQKQKQDIKELAQLFGGKLGQQKSAHRTGNAYADYTSIFQKAFSPKPGGRGVFPLHVENGASPILQLHIEPSGLTLFTQEGGRTDVELYLDQKVLDDIIEGRSSFQKAFMTGAIKMKGDFSVFRVLDEVLSF